MRRSFLEEGIYETNINMKKVCKIHVGRKKESQAERPKKQKQMGKKNRGMALHGTSKEVICHRSMWLRLDVRGID